MFCSENFRDCLNRPVLEGPAKFCPAVISRTLSGIFMILAQPFLYCEVEFLPPVPAETALQRIPEEFVGSHSSGTPESLGTSAYFPAVKIYCGKAVVILETHRIKTARYRFHIRDSAGPESRLEAHRHLPPASYLVKTQSRPSTIEVTRSPSGSVYATRSLLFRGERPESEGP